MEPDERRWFGKEFGVPYAKDKSQSGLRTYTYHYTTTVTLYNHHKSQEEWWNDRSRDTPVIVYSNHRDRRHGGMAQHTRDKWNGATSWSGDHQSVGP